MSDLDLMIYVDTILALIVVAFLIKSLIDEDIRKAKKIAEIFKKYESEEEKGGLSVDELQKIRLALKKISNGDLYDRKGELTKEGYEALEILEGLDLFWLGDPLIKLVSKKEANNDDGRHIFQ